MFGYAVNESDNFMPMTIDLSHKMAYRLEVRKRHFEVAPSGRETQVTVEYENNQPRRVHTVVVSSQHDDAVTHKQIQEALIEEVVKKSFRRNCSIIKPNFISIRPGVLSSEG